MTPVLIAVVVVGTAIAWVAYKYVSSLPPKEEPIHHFSCPSCRRKLRFKARQSGHQGQCPQCGQQLTFPKAT